MEPKNLFTAGVPCVAVRELAFELARAFAATADTQARERLAEQIALTIERRLNFSEHLNQLTALIASLALQGHEMRNYLLGFAIQEERIERKARAQVSEDSDPINSSE